MKIEPLRGYRHAIGGHGDNHAIGRAREVSKVVAPPYDQISPEMQAELQRLSTDNVVRITLPEGADYEGAAAVLRRWVGDGVWSREEWPAIYPYHQTYTAGGARVTRTGFVALGEVSDYTENVVLPHERTHSGPKQDRMRLLEATGADTGLLFMLVSDSAGDLRQATAATEAPIAEARDLRGELHELWRITDEAAIRRAQALMAGRRVIIADGHHRYETAVEYRRRHRAATHKLMAFFALEAPGLTILPNHRLVHGVPGFSLARLAEAARPWFEVTPLADPLAFRPMPAALGVVAGAEAAVFALRPESAGTIAWPPGTSAAWRGLAVSILHEGLLRPLLDITDAKLDARSHVDYTADQEEAVRLTRAGRHQAAFLIAPTTPEELLAVVSGGELLPQKSTHFYPKLLDGLVFHLLGGDA